MKHVGTSATGQDIATQSQLGGGAAVSALAVVNFGAAPKDQASVTVATTAVTANSMVLLALTAFDSADHTAHEHQIEALAFAPSNQLAGVGFDIMATCTDNFGLTGQWQVRWSLIG